MSAVTLIASGTGSLILQVYNLLSELGLGFSDTFSILINTSIGTTWLLRIVTSVLILVLIPVQYILVRKKKDKIGRTSTSISAKKIINIILYAILILGTINIFSNSMVSHNAAAEFIPPLAISVDWLHMMAVSIWLGGLFYISLILLYAIRISSNSPDYEIYSNAKEKTMIIRNSFSLAIMIPYFSMIAVISLGVISISGLYMAWLQLQSIGSLFDSLYGNILILKLCVIAPMIVLGAYHQIKLHYAMVQIAQQKKSKPQEQFGNIPNNLRQRDGKDSYINRGGRYDPFRRFSKTIKIESLIGITVLVITSFLTITSPPSMVHSDSQMQMDMQGSGGSNNNQITPTISDAFTITALILAITVLIVSLYYYRKSKQDLKITVDLLQRNEK
jgi:putative copper export protein